MNAAGIALPIGAAPAPRARRSVAAHGLAVAGIVVALGAAFPLRNYLSPRSGAGYWLGIAGGTLMLATLVYSVRRRFAGLSSLGAARPWFQAHIAFGVLGPILVLYHCGYRTGATNSNVALFSMLIVVASGFIGRYAQGRVSAGLSRRELALAELCDPAGRLNAANGGAGRLIPGYAARLEAAEHRIADGVFPLPKALGATISWRIERARLRRFVRSAIARAAARSSTLTERRSEFSRVAEGYIERRLAAAQRVAEFEGLCRLSSAWRALHLPLLAMMFAGGIVHVIAVSVY